MTNEQFEMLEPIAIDIGESVMREILEKHPALANSIDLEDDDWLFNEGEWPDKVKRCIMETASELGETDLTNEDIEILCDSSLYGACDAITEARVNILENELEEWEKSL